MEPFTILEHTADLALEARGRTFGELVLHAARGLIALLIGEAQLAPVEQERVVATGPTRERALLTALREMLAMIEDEERVPVAAALARDDAAAPELEVGCAPLEAASPYLGTEIKAVTYHDLRVADEGGVLRVRIVFDT